MMALSPSIFSLQVLWEISRRTRDVFSFAAQGPGGVETSVLLHHLATLHNAQSHALRRFLLRRMRGVAEAPRPTQAGDDEGAEIKRLLRSGNLSTVLTGCESLVRAVMDAYQKAHLSLLGDLGGQNLLARHYVDLRGALVFIDTMRREALSPAESERCIPGMGHSTGLN